jgi:hypothetical protein
MVRGAPRRAVDLVTPGRTVLGHDGEGGLACPVGNGWRGSPELLAHVAVAGLQAVQERFPIQRPDCLIDVKVDEDHEFFCSPEEFLERVTPEALQKFQSIEITISNAQSLSIFTLAWIPSQWWNPKWAFDPSKSDGSVILHVEGPDDLAVDYILAKMRTAANRGVWGFRESWQFHCFMAVIFVVALGTTLAPTLQWFRSYATGAEADWSWALLLAFLPALGLQYFAPWLFRYVAPPLEITSRRRLGRTLKFFFGSVMIPTLVGVTGGAILAPFT